MSSEKMFATRVNADVLEKFSKACKVMGFKQTVIIEEYMKHIIDRAEKVEVLKNLDFLIPLDLYKNTDRIEILVSSEDAEK